MCSVEGHSQSRPSVKRWALGSTLFPCSRTLGELEQYLTFRGTRDKTQLWGTRNPDHQNNKREGISRHNGNISKVLKCQ